MLPLVLLIISSLQVLLLAVASQVQQLTKLTSTIDQARTQNAHTIQWFQGQTSDATCVYSIDKRYRSLDWPTDLGHLAPIVHQVRSVCPVSDRRLLIATDASSGQLLWFTELL